MVRFSYPLPFQLGRTKVFLRAGQIGVLDSRRAEVLDNAAKVIQRRLQTFIARRDFVSARAASFALQAYCRGSCAPTGTYQNFILFVFFLVCFSFSQFHPYSPFSLGVK